MVKAVAVHLLYLEKFRSEKMHVSTDEIVDRSTPLPDTNEAQCCVLTEWYRNYMFGYARRMTMVFFCAAVRPDGTTCASVAHNVYKMKFLKNGYLIAMLNGRHRHDSMEVSKD